MRSVLIGMVVLLFAADAQAADIASPPAKHLTSCDYALQMADHDLTAYRTNFAGAIEQSQKLADENAALKKELEALKAKDVAPKKE